MKKETVSRFSVSLPPSLLRQLDEMSGMFRCARFSRYDGR
jgi:metal-responsive CopG/Arc/MetJ family transcriptional regulator